MQLFAVYMLPSEFATFGMISHRNFVSEVILRDQLMPWLTFVFSVDTNNLQLLLSTTKFYLHNLRMHNAHIAQL